MSNNVTGSLNQLIEDLSELMSEASFESDLKDAFGDKCYILNNKAPNPFWVYSQTTHQMICLRKNIELLPVDYNPSYEKVECFVLQNIVNIPIEYITEMSWN